MLISDLEAGDKIKFTDRYLDYWRFQYRTWCDKCRNRIFEVSRISISGNEISIWSDEYPEINRVGVNFDGLDNGGRKVFEIVELKDD